MNQTDACNALKTNNLRCTVIIGSQYNPQYQPNDVGALQNNGQPANVNDQVPATTIITLVLNPANPNQPTNPGQTQSPSQGAAGTTGLPGSIPGQPGQ